MYRSHWIPRQRVRYDLPLLFIPLPTQSAFGRASCTRVASSVQQIQSTSALGSSLSPLWIAYTSDSLTTWQRASRRFKYSYNSAPAAAELLERQELPTWSRKVPRSRAFVTTGPANVKRQWSPLRASGLFRSSAARVDCPRPAQQSVDQACLKVATVSTGFEIQCPAMPSCRPCLRSTSSMSTKPWSHPERLYVMCDLLLYSRGLGRGVAGVVHVVIRAA